MYCIRQSPWEAGGRGEEEEEEEEEAPREWKEVWKGGKRT